MGLFVYTQTLQILEYYSNYRKLWKIICEYCESFLTFSGLEKVKVPKLQNSDLPKTKKYKSSQKDPLESWVDWSSMIVHESSLI